MHSNHILVGVSGGIAVYKVCDLVSKLTKEGFEVRVLMSKHAARFVSPLTFEALCHHEVYVDMFSDTLKDPIPHINLAKWADLFILAPATANSIAKAVCGLADDLLSSTMLALACPKLMAPAMNTHMLENPVTKRNIQMAKELGWLIIEPDFGHLACMEDGKGRLAPTPELIDHIRKHLPDFHSDQKASDAANPLPQAKPSDPQQTPAVSLPLEQDDFDVPMDQKADDILMEDYMKELQPLKDKHVLISAGPTQEALDPVRFVSNHSSGKQGYAIAEDALSWGAKVILVSGPVSLAAPEGAEMVYVTSALEMEKALVSRADWADFIIMAAAVGDYRPKEASASKIKKSDDSLVVEFVRNPDILQQLGKQKRKDQVLCGFAMETENLDANAREKLEKKNCDLLIANNLSTPGAGFQTDTNVVSLLKPDVIEHLPLLSKKELGYTILAEMLEIQKGNF